MNIAIIGAGHIGAHLARQCAKTGHEVTLAFSHDEQRLQDLAHQIGPGVQAASPSAGLMWSSSQCPGMGSMLPLNRWVI